MADGVLLLDNETRVIYATPQVDQVLKRHDSPFALSPKFTLHHPHHAARFAAFVNGKNQETGPLSLLLEGENGCDLLLLNCIQFPKSSRTGFTSRPLHDHPVRSQSLSFPAMAAFQQTIQFNPGRSAAVPLVCGRFDPQRLLRKMDSHDQHRTQPAPQRVRARPPRTGRAIC